MAAYTTIDNPELYFQVELFTGTGSALSATLDGDTNMQPDLVWLKNRDAADSHELYDAVRGATKQLAVDQTDQEITRTDGLTAFNSDGFSIGDREYINTSGEKMVAWCWKESATAGFDIVSYTGNGSARTISHSLSAVPKMYIIKNLGEADSWQVYHAGNTAAPETDYLQLNETGATGDSAARFNDTAPTSSVFSVGDHVTVNKNTISYIAYAFAPKQGFSKFGSFEGNSSSDGTYIHLGFSAAFILVKNTTSTSNWELFDNKRPGYNTGHGKLYPNSNSSEDTDQERIDILSNGFKCRSTNVATNESGSKFIYLAFAEAPFVNSNGAPCNAR